MKKKVLFSIALAGLMLGSCSKDAIDNGGNGASWNENGEGYISLSLNLPSTTNGSRVGEEGSGTSFDDGEGNEYAVKDAVLVLFSGTEDDETKVTFNSAYKLNLGNWENNSSDQITTSAKIVQKINEIKEANIYALVVLNSNGVLNVTEDAKLKIGTSGADFSGTLEALNTAVTALTNETDKTWSGTGFLMSNSPLFTDNGGTEQPSGLVKTLVKIETANIFKTIEEAISKPAASIYVERAQAKVQLVDKTSANNTFKITDKTGTEVTYTYKIGNWDIDNFNVQSSLTRNFDPTWAPYQNAKNNFYRFVDAKEVENGAGVYRTYWGKDVNYDAITTTAVPTIALSPVAKTGEIPTLAKTPGTFTYCFENTTAAVPATGKDLTRVIISANLWKQTGSSEGADFFVVNDDRSTIYLSDVDTEGAGSIQQRIETYVLGLQSVQDVIKANVSNPENFNGANLTVALNLPGQSGILNNNIITITVKDGNSVSFNNSDTSKAAIKNAIETALQSATDFVIDYYKGGVCYYQAFIRHFTESECPWTEGEDQKMESSKYLGRYGVLRNNWYVLNVNSIKQIGDSTYPVIPENPIDEEEFYLSVDINILAWAKREQDVDL